MSKKNQNSADFIQKLNFSFDLPSDSIAVRLDPDTDKFILPAEGKPQVSIVGSGSTYSLVLTYPLSTVHVGPKSGINLKPGDNFFTTPLKDILKSGTPAISVRRDNVTGLAIVDVESVFTKAVKVEHG